jgi:hypothetical protein
MLKRLRAACISTIALLCGPSFAAGPYDGIYVISNFGQTQYLSAHTNGTTLIVAAFWTLPAANINFYLGDGQAFQPARLDVWDLYSGTMAGNQVIISGESNFGACISNYFVVFDSTGASITRRGMSTTNYGASKGISCEAFYATAVTTVGTAIRATKVF